MFSLWFAVVPSYCSLPKGEDYSLKSNMEVNPNFSSRVLRADSKCCLFSRSRVCYMPASVVDVQHKNSTAPGLRSNNFVLCSSSLQR